jgi:hypothetical protein
VFEHGRLKGTGRLERKEVVMELLGKERKIAEREHGVTVSLKTRIVHLWKKIKERGTGDLIGLDSAMPCHPVVPVCDF